MSSRQYRMCKSKWNFMLFDGKSDHPLKCPTDRKNCKRYSSLTQVNSFNVLPLSANLEEGGLGVQQAYQGRGVQLIYKIYGSQLLKSWRKWRRLSDHLMSLAAGSTVPQDLAWQNSNFDFGGDDTYSWQICRLPTWRRYGDCFGSSIM